MTKRMPITVCGWEPDRTTPAHIWVWFSFAEKGDFQYVDLIALEMFPQCIKVRWQFGHAAPDPEFGSYAGQGYYVLREGYAVSEFKL